MYRCPKCRCLYLQKHIIYSHGTADTYYTCLCGYDSRDGKIYFTDRTDFRQTTGFPSFSYSVNQYGGIAGPVCYRNDVTTGTYLI